MLCLGDNGPWEQKCQYAGRVGPFMGKWQTSRGINNKLFEKLQTYSYIVVAGATGHTIKSRLPCVRWRLS